MAEYALYRGDQFLDVGKAIDLAERMKVSVGTIYFYASPSYKNRTRENAVKAYKLDDDEVE